MEKQLISAPVLPIGEGYTNNIVFPPSGNKSWLGLDLANKIGDTGSVQVWDRKSGKIVLTISTAECSLGFWWKQIRKKLQRDYKALTFAVTHNLAIRIYCRDTDGTEGYFELTKPSEVRRIYRMCHFIPRFKIVGNDGTPYEIKRGKVRPMRTYKVDESFSQLAKHKEKMS